MIGRNKMKAVSLALACVLITGACSSGLVKSLKAMNALRQRLIQKYHDEVVVNVQNSRFLSIVFVNSSLNKKDSTKRRARAEDTARFVALNYEDIRSIEQIWIGFVAAESKFIVYHRTEVIESFGFDKNGTPFGDESNVATDVRAPVVRFSAVANQTDVSVTRIQLDGDMKKGLALVPHFVVSGDARQAGNAISPPDYVVFDFASYSDKPLFLDKANLEIVCDGQPALKGFARLLSTGESGTNETIAQFLSIRMSFKAFNRIAHARNVTIKLAPKRFELLPDDINALARMAAYVRAPESGEK